MIVKMSGVREYNEGLEVELVLNQSTPGVSRWVIKAYADGGFTATYVDLLDLIAWLRDNEPPPDLLSELTDDN